MANKTFSDWLASLAQATVQPGDLIPVVQGGVSKKAPAGQAGGLATVGAAGVLAQRVGVLHSGSLATQTTTQPVDSGPQISFTAERAGYALVVVRVEMSPYSGSPRSAVGIYRNGTRVSSLWSAQTNELAVDMPPAVAIVEVAPGDVIDVRFGIFPGCDNGTNEVKLWSPFVWMLELGGES